MSLILSFDIGYASIGWCVLSAKEKAPAIPDILGTGVVTFPTDDCLASRRRDLRRTRRHIRSTRQRIERMKRWLVHRGVLERADLDKPGHPAPFLLAAAALQGHRELNAWELWTVLRWYAHNRGYDGNSRWANDEEETEDTQKVIAANDLMSKHVTKTMCETVCACLDLDPAKSRERISSTLPYKTLNAAYPRKVVTAEVSTLLSQHIGKIPGLDTETVRLVMKSSDLDQQDREKLAAADIKLVKRYTGGLLFGQLVPRFDNRIIARCPITWAKTYDESIAEGKTDEQARKQADKFAKVPAAKSPEFLEYRFARILANIKADGKPIDKDLRGELWQQAAKQGRLTHGDIEKAIIVHCGDVPTNIDAYFKLHPDSEEALVLDPVMDEVRKAEGSRAKLSPLWKQLPEETKTAAIAEWRKGKKVSLGWLLEQSKDADDHPAILAQLEKDFATLKPKRGEHPYASLTEYLLKSTVGPKIPTGRAPYARPVLRKVVEEVRSGWDATKANKVTDPENGEDKPEDGILYDLGIPGSRVRVLQAERPLDKLTNNHLVRQRLKILERLIADLVTENPGLTEAETRIIVEVGRDLKEFSGKTAKEIEAELKYRLKDFRAAVEHLAEFAPDLPVNGSLIRKCRIAMDMNWHCPFTGDHYSPWDLQKLEREHIIPYATRSTNALHALVLTWPEVNRMKRKRTARQFIIEDGSRKVPNRENLTIMTIRNYEAFVANLDTKGHPDDFRRKRARKALLMTMDFNDKELGFTDGAMTQTSHLTKLAMRSIKERLPGAVCSPIPGAVTAEIRKSWGLLGTLALACPEILDPTTEDPKPKDEIRGLTHLHHALDAATIGLIACYFPFNRRGEDQTGNLWSALLKRNRTEEEQDRLYRLGIFTRYQKRRIDKSGKEFSSPDVYLNDLPPVVKQNLAVSLAQTRVMQHVPADRSGTSAELNTWGVAGIEGSGDEARVTLEQRSSTIGKDGKTREFKRKKREERAGKLLGPHPTGGKGKLKEISGALIINENYGLALDPEPVVIPFHDVHARLEKLRTANGGKPIRVLRNGMLIRLLKNPPRSRQDYSGIWRIASIKNNKGTYLLDMIRPGYVTPQNGVIWSGMNKTLGPLLECGLEILPRNYSAPVS